MQPAIELKHKLSQSRPVLGTLLTNQVSLELIEVAINAGLDYVILDTEHNFHNGPLLADACRLGRMANFPILRDGELWFYLFNQKQKLKVEF